MPQPVLLNPGSNPITRTPAPDFSQRYHYRLTRAKRLPFQLRLCGCTKIPPFHAKNATLSCNPCICAPQRKLLDKGHSRRRSRLHPCLPRGVPPCPSSIATIRRPLAPSPTTG